MLVLVTGTGHENLSPPYLSQGVYNAGQDGALTPETGLTGARRTRDRRWKFPSADRHRTSIAQNDRLEYSTVSPRHGSRFARARVLGHPHRSRSYTLSREWMAVTRTERSSIHCREESVLTAEEKQRFDGFFQEFGISEDIFIFFESLVGLSTDKTRFMFVKAFAGDELVGLAMFARIAGHSLYGSLNARMRKHAFLETLGGMMRSTVYFSMHAISTPGLPRSFLYTDEGPPGRGQRGDSFVGEREDGMPTRSSFSMLPKRRRSTRETPLPVFRSAPTPGSTSRDTRRSTTTCRFTSRPGRSLRDSEGEGTSR